MRSDQHLLRGRPHGGMAVLWRKTLGSRCRVIDLQDNRLMGLEVTNDNGCKLFILNVYLPYSCYDNKDEYLFYLSKIENLLSSCDTPYSMACGDFNAHTNMTDNTSHLFGKCLEKFCREEDLAMPDSDLLPRDSYTFIDSSSDTTHWLDHCVSTMSMQDIVSSAVVEYDCISSDHHPLIVKISLSNINLEAANVKQSSKRRCIKWDKLSQEELLRYKLLSEEELSKVQVNHSLILCDDPHCSDPSHRNAIDRMYGGMCEALLTASSQFQRKPSHGHNQVQGWNTYCKEVHSLARDAYLLWRSQGRQRHGVLHENMKRSRAQFKRALRQCRNDTSTTTANSLANKLLAKDDKSFWKEISKANNRDTPLASTVNGVSGSDNISSMWKEHFEDLLNSSKDTTSKSFVDECVQDKQSYYLNRFTPSEIIEGISSLKKGKSPGNDDIYSEHFIYAHDKLSFVLSMIFNAMVIHGYIPQSMMDTVLIPIIKDKKGSVTDKNNYRPVAITCISSKILELVLLDRYSGLLHTTHNQFGFKAKLGTDLCVFTLKQVVEYYRSLSSPVYAAFLDASKAFDKVNHYHLLYKLIKRKIPIVIIRLLYFWFTHQVFMVRWGSSISSCFTVTNGVRQGGILSPLFFNLYLDELSMVLNECNTGCSINSCVTNHLFYADDSVLLGPSPSSLQSLINLCELYANKFELTFNIKKTKVMCFRPKVLSRIFIPEFVLDSKVLSMVSSHCYLGVVIEDSYADNGDLSRQTRSIYARGNALIKRFSMCDTEVKVKLFKSYCSSFYCSQLWSSFTTTAFRKLQSSYNRILRCLFKLDSDCSISAKCLELYIDCMKVLLRKSVYSFRSRIMISDNIIVQSIARSNFFLYSNICKRWTSLLF